MPIATSSDKIILSSEKKTEELANKLLKKLKLGDVIFLYGEIGVGKTTFVRYLINGFQKENNIKLTEVTSPTFNIINEYEINQTKINHYDLFRIKSVEETNNLGLFDNLSNSITLVEWPQIIKEKPKNLIEFDFKYENDHQQRYVEIKGLNFNFK
jgi:tRNA threonylcarbamoyladenosine biosynthesis protein TsaE